MTSTDKINIIIGAARIVHKVSTDALFNEKLNIFGQNFNPPAKSCVFVTSTMTHPEQGLTTKDSLLTWAATTSQTGARKILAPNFGGN